MATIIHNYKRKIAFAFGCGLILSVATLTVIVIFDLFVSLDFMNAELEARASRLIGRKVTVEGPIQLKPSFQPIIVVQDVAIANPHQWESGKLLKAGKALVQIEILPLIRGEIKVNRVLFESVSVEITRQPNGQVNWQFNRSYSEDNTKITPRIFPELEKITLRNLQVKYDDGLKGRRYEFKIDQLSGVATGEKNLHLSGNVTYQNKPYIIEITGGKLADLVSLKRAWPVDVSLESGSISLMLSGKLYREKELQSDLAVHLAGDRLGDLSSALGIDIPHLGPFVLGGRLGVSASQVSVSDLSGAVGKTSFSGSLSMGLKSEKPTLSGALSIDTLDLGPLLFESDNSNEEYIKTSSATVNSESKLAFEVSRLPDADLTVKIKHISGIPGDLRDVELDLLCAKRSLNTLLKLNIAGADIAGNFDINAMQEEPAFSMHLHTQSVDLKRALSILAGSALNIDGSFGAIGLRVSTQGGNLRDLLNRVDMKIQVAQSRVEFKHKAEQAPVVINLNGLSILRGANQKLDVQAVGDFLGESFDLRLAAENPVEYLDNRQLPLKLLFNGVGATVNMDGVLNPEQEKDKIRIKMSAHGQSIGDLAAWTGFSRDADLAYRVAGIFIYHGPSLQFDFDTIRIGQAEMKGALGYKGLNSTSPTFDFRIAAETLGVEQLQELEALSRTAEIDAEKEIFKLENLFWDMDILPDDLKFFSDGDIHINVKKINVGTAIINDVGFDAGFRDGKMISSPFQATVGDETFKGEVALDFESDTPSVRFSLNTDHVHIPKLLQHFNITSPIYATAGHFGVEFTLRGRRAIDILKLSEVMVKIENGTWRVSHIGGLGETEITVAEALYTTSPEKPALLKVVGYIGDIPVAINMTENGMFTHDLSEPFFMSLEVKVAETDLKVEAHLTVQEIIQSDLRLHVSLTGDRMDSLNTLFGLNLPPLGPYEISGKLNSTPSNATLKNMLVRIGKSQLKGEIRVWGEKNSDGNLKLPAYVNSTFTADSIQLRDFKLEGWSPFQDIKQRVAEQTAKIKTGGISVESPLIPIVKGVNDEEEELKSLFNPQFTRYIEALLSVEVKEVLSGNDKLGHGLLTARLKDGRFMVDPLRIDIPGGSLEITAGIKVSENETDAEITMNIEHLDYGVLARRLAPQSAMKGWLYLDVDLRSRAENQKDLMQSASGHFDFGVTPERLDAGVFDLWAANVVTSILPLLTHKEESEVNCLAARFDMQNGIMKHKEILLDTTKVQVHGRGEVNFLDQKIHLRLLPHPKKPQFFNLATPLVINGTFSDFHVGVNTGDILGSVVRFITSTITVPFQWLIYHKLPADGLEACSQALQREKDK